MSENEVAGHGSALLAFNPSTKQTTADGALEFQASLVYIMSETLSQKRTEKEKAEVHAFGTSHGALTPQPVLLF